MHHPPPVRLVQRVGYFHSVAQHLLGWERPLLQPPRQRLSLQILHHQVIDLVGPANVVERANVGMIQRGDGASFPLKTAA